MARDHPHLPEAILTYAHVLYLDREPCYAIEVLQVAADDEEASTSWLARCLLAEICTRHGELEPGNVATLDEAEAAPHTASEWYLRLFATLEPSIALESAKEALRRAPDHRLAMRGVVGLSEVTGDFTEAVAGITALLAAAGPDRDLLIRRCRLLLRLERPSDALRTLDELVTAFPDDRVGYVRRANVCRHLGRYRQTPVTTEATASTDFATPGRWKLRSSPRWGFSRRCRPTGTRCSRSPATNR